MDTEEVICTNIFQLEDCVLKYVKRTGLTVVPLDSPFRRLIGYGSALDDKDGHRIQWCIGLSDLKRSLDESSLKTVYLSFFSSSAGRTALADLWNAGQVPSVHATFTPS
jgi:hypothetical protein